MDPYQQHHSRPPSDPVGQVDMIEEVVDHPRQYEHQHLTQCYPDLQQQQQHQNQQQQQQQRQQQQEINRAHDNYHHNPHNLALYQPPQLHSAMQPMVPPQAHIVPSSSSLRSSDSVVRISEPPFETSRSSFVTMPSEAPSNNSRASSMFGSLYQHKQHVRKSSSVLGWDSDDDEELDKVTLAANGINKEGKSATRPGSTTESEDFPPAMSEKSPWLRKEHVKQKQVRTCLCLGVILCFLVLGVILVFTLKEQMARRVIGSSPHRADKGGQNGEDIRKILHESIEATYHVNKTINRDDRFSNVLYGLDYTPRGSQEPDCKVNLGNVIEDMKMISQLTNRIRLYGMACRQAEYVIKAIEYLGLDQMQVILTLWVDSNPKASWERQSKMFWHLIDNDLFAEANDSTNNGPQTAATPTITDKVHAFNVGSRINGISVGNEVLFRNEDNSKPKEHVPLETLMNYMTQIRTGLAERAATAAASSNPTVVAQGQELAQIPVFSSDLGRNAHQIVDKVDWVLSNIHPFFAYTDVKNAAAWAFANYKDETLVAAEGKPAMISEVGWPSGPSSANMGSAVPSIENLQTFLDTWVCQANRKNIPYYYFEAFDEPWKNSINPREAQWGLMTVDRQLKVTMPVC